MPNERLRDALHKQGLTPTELAARVKVDPKTAERWVTQGRAPYPKYRSAIAAALRESESYLWPDAYSDERRNEASQSEVAHIYPRRGALPPELWQRLLDGATRQIGILAYAGLFLPEQHPRWVPTMRAKAEAGVQIEILLGDPDGSQIAERGEDEGIGDAMAGKVRNVLAFYRELRDLENVAIYFHNTTLYNSIYRFDDDMLVNTHLYGTPAAYAPVMHLRRIAGGELFDNYTASFNRVLSKSRVVWPEAW
ncbi:helix-turn-helix domain-containing protein [Krasilnikovia sp. MM14-A1259]|uniref:helix-turn-helix domain-containing protein n=1 Tax=Krasilnikovia sp. MM14-A1259 TaxID=3373539 RepID=UPI00380EB4C1